MKINGTTVCQLPAEADCTRTMCGGALVCASDLRCRSTCLSATDCSNGQVCVGGVCADPVELDVTGVLPQKGPSLALDGGVAGPARDAGGRSSGPDLAASVVDSGSNGADVQVGLPDGEPGDGSGGAGDSGNRGEVGAPDAPSAQPDVSMGGTSGSGGATGTGGAGGTDGGSSGGSDAGVDAPVMSPADSGADGATGTGGATGSRRCDRFRRRDRLRWCCRRGRRSCHGRRDWHGRRDQHGRRGRYGWHARHGWRRLRRHDAGVDAPVTGPWTLRLARGGAASARRSYRQLVGRSALVARRLRAAAALEPAAAAPVDCLATY